MAQRARRRRKNGALSPPTDTPQPYTSACLFPLLQPVRYCLHSFLSTKDAVRLMRASRSTTASLLSDYAALDHIFKFTSAANARRSIAFHGSYHIRILRMCLPADWTEPLVDSESGRSLLPASLVALMLGLDHSVFLLNSVVYVDQDSNRSRREVQWDGKEEEKQLNERLERWQEMNCCDMWEALGYGLSMGAFNQPIPPGALPHGLRFLQFSALFNQPLQVGSIPDTVEVLQFGRAFNQPLAVGHLPASLTQLIFGSNYNQPLLPGVLPPALQLLHLGMKYNHSVQSGTLPAQLQGLSMGWDYNQPILPGVIPASVTHLRLSRFYNAPLQSGSIPHGVVHLSLGGDRFNHPIPPGVLPASLRELVISRQYNQVLQPGSLPDGLKLLAFDQHSCFGHALQPGVVPASVVAISMGAGYKQRLVSGGIPSTVRWLRLPWEYARRDLSGVLSCCTHIVYWEEDTTFSDWCSGRHVVKLVSHG